MFKEVKNTSVEPFTVSWRRVFKGDFNKNLLACMQIYNYIYMDSGM